MPVGEVCFVPQPARSLLPRRAGWPFLFLGILPSYNKPNDLQRTTTRVEVFWLASITQQKKGRDAPFSQPVRSSAERRHTQSLPRASGPESPRLADPLVSLR